MDKAKKLATPFTTSQLWSFFVQICRGLNSLHSRSPPIVHRDLKLANIFMCENSIIKVRAPPAVNQPAARAHELSCCRWVTWG